jgi:hypothetical protein
MCGLQPEVAPSCGRRMLPRDRAFAGSETAAMAVEAGKTPSTRDPLDMLVTSEPVAELDDALRCMGHQLREARHRHDDDASTRLRRWIDGRLDERNTFRDGPIRTASATGSTAATRGVPPPRK